MDKHTAAIMNNKDNQFFIIDVHTAKICSGWPSIDGAYSELQIMSADQGSKMHLRIYTRKHTEKRIRIGQKGFA